MKKLTILASLLTLCLSTEATSIEINTGNILSNPGFTGGTSSWTNQGTTQQHHTNYGNECNPNTANNFSTTCGVAKGSLAGVDDGGVNQTVTLSEDTNMGTPEIQRGFTSNMSADIWFWHGKDKVTMTQTLTDSSGDVNTQIRIVEDDHNIYKTYTDSIIIGANTSTDFSINAKIDIDDSSNSSSHAGPDVDNVELSVTYNTSDGDELDLEDELDFEDDIEWEEEDWTWEEEEFAWEDDFYFEEEFNTDWENYDVGTEFEEMYVEEFNMPEDTPIMEEEFETIAMPEEEFEEMYMEEFEDIEEAFMDTTEEPPIMEEEFEEETLDMEVEEGENMTAESEVDEEMEMEEEAEEMEVAENDEEPTEETTETMEEEPEPEESPQEVASDENEADGEESIESESIEEEKTVEVKKEKIKTVDTKVKTKIEEIKVDEIKVAKIKPTLFSDQPNLDTYSNVSFYAPEDLNYEVNDDFFEQMSLDMYNKQIYTNISLSGYIQNDPVEVHRKKMEEITIKKRTLMIELQQLKNE